MNASDRQELISKIESPSDYLIETIFYYQGLEHPTSPYRDYSGPTTEYYRTIAQDPELSAIAIVNYKRSWTRTRLTKEELASTYLKSARYINANSNPKILSQLGVYETAKEALQILTEKAADRKIELWASPTGGLDPHAPTFLFFQQFLTQRWLGDVYGRAGEILKNKPDLLIATRNAFESKFRPYVLNTVLTEKEISKAKSSEHSSQSVDLECSQNTLAVFKNLLEHLNLTELAYNAYYMRMKTALALNPHNTAVQINSWMWEKQKPDSLKQADQLRSSNRFVHGAIPKNKVLAIKAMTGSAIIDEKNRHGFENRDGLSLRKLKIGYADGTEGELYEVGVWFAGGDDADEWNHLFPTLSLARQTYAGYLNPDLKSTDSGQFTAKAIYADGTSKELRNATLVEGKYIFSNGRPMFSKTRTQLAELTAENLKKIEQNSIDEYGDYRLLLDDERNKSCLLQLGENPGGPTLVNLDTEKGREEFGTKELSIICYNCWETGINYYQLSTRLPTDLFNSLKGKTLIWYHSEEIEEEGNWKGWCSTDVAGMETYLAEFGWTIKLSN